jgi:PhnB protein
MQSLNTYLIFDGNCRQAMEFYEKCLGGVLYVSTYGEMPGDACKDFPPETRNWVMHARLTIKTQILMASDRHPHMPIKQGNNFFVSINGDDTAEAERLFKALSEKGSVEMPLQETSWAVRFGMLTDQFGIKWMINIEKK